jgi:predicted nucleotidyltransferase
MASAANLFRTIPAGDPLGFWADRRLDLRRVADFLDMEKSALAELTGVAPASVRFDDKAPAALIEHLEAIATLVSLVAERFHDDGPKTALWLRTRNPLLNDLSPLELIRTRRYATLQRRVMAALLRSPEHSVTEGAAVPAASTGAPAGPASLQASLITRHRAAIERLCRQFGVTRLSAFGSILRADFDPTTSDIDFVVEFASVPGTPAAAQYFDFKQALEQLLDRPVDLVELQALPESRLKRVIERTQVPVYEQAA